MKQKFHGCHNLRGLPWGQGKVKSSWLSNTPVPASNKYHKAAMFLDYSVNGEVN